MDVILVALQIFALLNAKQAAKSDSEDIIAMLGCNISLIWTLPYTRKILPNFDILRLDGNLCATFTPSQQCDVIDNSSMLCNANRIDDFLILVLNIFNVNVEQSGNYTVRMRTAFDELKSQVPEEPWSTTKRVVIGKPQIMEVWKPILGKPFQMICYSTHQQEHYVYRWKINSREITTDHNVNSYTISNLAMTDNFNDVTCQVCLNKHVSNSSSVTCENDGCWIESDPYTIQVIYGPYSVSLSQKERQFRLKEYDIFTIECVANCYPKCLFRWKGRDTIESRYLNIIFEPRMSGQYTCHVTNQETNITLVSDTIILYHTKGDETWDNKEVLIMGLVGVAVLLAVIGMFWVRQRRKTSHENINPQVLNELVAHLQTRTNGEMSQEISWMQNRPLPAPNNNETLNRRRYKPHHLNQERRSRSLHNLLAFSQNMLYPLQDGLSLQALNYSPYMKDRLLRNGMRANGPIERKPVSNYDDNSLGNVSRLELGYKPELLYAEVRKDMKTNRDEHRAVAKSEPIYSLEKVDNDEASHENPYNTVGEAKTLRYYDARSSITNGNSNEMHIYNRHGEFDNVSEDSLCCKQNI